MAAVVRLVSAGLQAIGISAGVANVIAYAAVAAANYAIGDALAAQVPSPGASDGQLSVQQPVPFRRRVYGRAKMGGFFVFSEVADRSLYQLIVIAGHEIDAIEESWVSDRRVVLDGDGWVTSVDYPAGAETYQFTANGHSRVRIETRLGAPGQVASPILIAAFPSIWTSNHVGIGMADALLQHRPVVKEAFGRVYPGGAQSYRGLIRGAKIIDPRIVTSPTTTAWSDNAVLVIRDYLSHEDGWRINPGYLDSGTAAAITQASADTCDELVPLKNGGTEKRYRLWGYYGFEEEPRNVLRRFLTACGGFLQPQPDGTIAIKVGEWETPTVTISDARILGYEIQHWQGEFETVNEVRAGFTDPDNDYQDTESVPWQDEDDISRRGHVRAVTVDCRHAPSYRQARRIQKIVMAEASPEWVINLTTNAYGLLARRQRFINLEIAELGLDLTCRITSFTANTRTGVCNIGLASFDASAYDWNASAEEGNAPPAPPDTSSDGAIETPANLTVTVETRLISGSVVGAVMVIVCDAPSDDDLTVRFEYQPDGGSSWTTVPVGSGVYEAETGIIADGTYDVRATFLTPNGNQSATFATVNNVIVAASAAAPSAPTGLTATLSSPAVTVLVAFTAPNSPSFYAARVWRNSSATFATATDISGAIYGAASSPLDYTDTPGAGTWYYWATAESISAAQSSPVGPVNVTL